MSNFKCTCHHCHCQQSANVCKLIASSFFSLSFSLFVSLSYFHHSLAHTHTHTHLHLHLSLLWIYFMCSQFIFFQMILLRNLHETNQRQQQKQNQSIACHHWHFNYFIELNGRIFRLHIWTFAYDESGSVLIMSKFLKKTKI